MFEAQKKFFPSKLIESRHKLKKITQPASQTNLQDFPYEKILLLYFFFALSSEKPRILNSGH